MISGISGLHGFQALTKINPEHATGQTAHAQAGTKDTVDIKPAVNMSDEEAQQLLQEVSGDIGMHQADALSVNQGLDYNRVMALLGEV